MDNRILIASILGFLVFVSGCNSKSPIHADGENIEQGEINFEIYTTKKTSKSAEEVFELDFVAYLHDTTRQYIWNSVLNEQRVGDVLISPDPEIRSSKDLEDMKQRIKALDPLVTSIISKGGSVQFVMQGIMPEWLSSDPGNNGDLFEGGLSSGQLIKYHVPPKNYTQWQELVKEFVNHFNNELNTQDRIYYILGNEPESYWVGDENELHKYYLHFAVGAMEADENVKIGGITTVRHTRDDLTKYNPAVLPDGSVDFTTIHTENPLTYNWIKFSSENNLPIHYVTFHEYPAASPVPSEGARWFLIERDVNLWLSEFGYDPESVEILINDWPDWKPVEEENDNEFKASYVASGLISMSRTKNVRPLYLGIRDVGSYSLQNGEIFGAGTGLFTPAGLKKPVYNLYSMLSKMKGNIINIDTGDDFVVAVASAENDSIHILVTNFIPSKRMISVNTFGVDLEEGALEESGKKIAAETGESNPDKIINDIISGRINVTSFEIDENVKTYLTRLREMVKKSDDRISKNVNVGIRVILPDGKWKHEEYFIDDTRANSYAIRDDIINGIPDSKNPAEAENYIESVNKKTNLDSGKSKDVEVDINNGNYFMNVQLKPYSTVLISLTKK